MREVERPATRGERNDVRKNGDQPGREEKERKRREAKLILEKKNKQYIGSFEYRVNRFRFSGHKGERKREGERGFMLAASQNIDNILPDE